MQIVKPIALSLLLSGLLPLTAQITYLHGGQLFDATNGSLQNEMTILVEGSPMVRVE